VSENFGGLADPGAVNVLYGSDEGLVADDLPSTRADQFFTQDSPNVEGVAEDGDFFGRSLAAGDFNGDGFDDLAIGAPGEDLGNVGDAGAVHVLYGVGAGLSPTTTPNDELWHQDVPGIGSSGEEGDWFGGALAAGDFDADGLDDLAIGVPDEGLDDAPVDRAGIVQVLYGASHNGGLGSAGAQLWAQGVGGVNDQSEADGLFGWALASANFGNGGQDDLAIGVYGEDVQGLAGAGAVNVIYGSAHGLTTAGIADQFWTQASNDVGGEPGVQDRFGGALAAFDFGGSGHADLAIGAQLEDSSGQTDAGAVNVIYGSPNGLSATGTPDDLWHQDNASVGDSAEPYDRFGGKLPL